MASFSFGFQGEDIDEDSDNLGPAAQATLTHQAIDQPSEVVTDVPQTHTLREILDLMPAHVAFELIPEMERAHGLRLLRRPLWDVRIQMMQEDQLNGVAPDGLEQGRSLGLGDEDVLRGVYEGGLKSWESSYDLASILQEDLETLLDKYTHFIEV